MSGRPKRKRSKKSDAAEDNVANDEVIDVEVDDGTGDVVGSRNQKRSRRQRATNPPTPPTIDPESSSSSSSSTLLNTHPHSRLPSYLSEAFSDLYSQDGLVVLGRGLGWLGLLCSFVRFYADASDDGYAATLDGGGGGGGAIGGKEK
jgi:hypothetical protein